MLLSVCDSSMYVCVGVPSDFGFPLLVKDDRELNSGDVMLLSCMCWHECIKLGVWFGSWRELGKGGR